MSTGQVYASQPPHQLDGTQRAERAPSGKPYTWDIDTPDNPEMVALRPEAVVQRTLAKVAAFDNMIERTAAFLVVLSRTNGYEGRDPLVITDDMRCGTVSSFLGIEIDTLGRVLVEMERRGWICGRDDGMLQIRDLAALDAVSEGGRPQA
jgi:hypothetical protein